MWCESSCSRSIGINASSRFGGPGEWGRQRSCSIGTVRETFLVGQLCYQHKVEYTKTGDLLVDRFYTIEIGGKSKEGKQIASLENAYIASDDIEYAAGNKIPLWAFGFLY